MLLRNQSYINQTLGKMHSGGVTNPLSQFKPEVMFNRFFLEDTTHAFTNQRDSFPTGTQPPYSYVLGPKAGLLSSTVHINGTGGITANLISGGFIEADLSGVGSLSGSLSLIASIAANLSGAGSVSADLKITLSLVATLAGSGDLEGALALLVPLNASLSGVGGVTAELKGNADMSATIYVNSGAATTQELVAAIWGALAADYNESGTMGNKLNGAGSAGDPWTTDISGYNTANTAGKILKDAKTKAALAASLSA